jgi:CRP/FNR family transcriptional regulator
VAILDTLRRCDLFSSLNDEDLKIVSSLFDEASYGNNETIFNEGDPSDRFYIVAEGSVKVIKHTVMGKDVILEMMSPGDIFGGVAVLDRKPYPASAHAMERATVISIGRNDLLNLMEEFPVLKLEVVKYFSNKLRDAHEMLKNIATERVERRIAALLLKLSEKVGVDDGEYRRIDFPLTRQEIAEMVGTTVETCIRTISRFQKKGIVRSSDGRVSIKVAALKQIVEE